MDRFAQIDPLDCTDHLFDAVWNGYARRLHGHALDGRMLTCSSTWLAGMVLVFLSIFVSCRLVRSPHLDPSDWLSRPMATNDLRGSFDRRTI